MKIAKYIIHNNAVVRRPILNAFFVKLNYTNTDYHFSDRSWDSQLVRLVTGTIVLIHVGLLITSRVSIVVSRWMCHLSELITWDPQLLRPLLTWLCTTIVCWGILGIFSQESTTVVIELPLWLWRDNSLILTMQDIATGWGRRLELAAWRGVQVLRRVWRLGLLSILSAIIAIVRLLLTLGLTAINTLRLRDCLLLKVLKLGLLLSRRDSAWLSLIILLLLWRCWGVGLCLPLLIASIGWSSVLLVMAATMSANVLGMMTQGLVHLVVVVRIGSTCSGNAHSILRGSCRRLLLVMSCLVTTLGRRHTHIILLLALCHLHNEIGSASSCWLLSVLVVMHLL
jgi:hypothetical protein